MIRMLIITTTGIERHNFPSADQAQNHLDRRTDVLGFRAMQVPAKKRAKL